MDSASGLRRQTLWALPSLHKRVREKAKGHARHKPINPGRFGVYCFEPQALLLNRHQLCSFSRNRRPHEEALHGKAPMVTNMKPQAQDTRSS